MEFFLVIILVFLGCNFPGLLIDVMKMSPEDSKYTEKRYALCACFGAILLLLVLILN